MTTTRNYKLIPTAEILHRMVDKIINDDKVFAFDIETGYTDPIMRSKGSLQHYSPDYVVAGISFTNNPDWAVYVPLNHEHAENIDNAVAAHELWRLLRTGKGIPHNALMELNGMARFFRDNMQDDDEYFEEVQADGGIYPIFSDTMIESMLVGENKKKDLKTLSKEILHVDQVELIKLFEARPELKGLNDKGKYAKYNTTNLRFNVLPLDPDVVSYACEDSALTLEHHYRNYDLVKDLLIFKTELRLQPVLVRMEREGMLLDWAEYERRSREVEKFRNEYAEYVMDQFSEITGELININLNSPKQVAEVLFDKMGIKPTIITDSGAPSTGEKAMRMIVGKHPEIKNLLQYREIAKLLGSYINKYLNELRYDPSGRAHPSHKQEGAGTGRFSVDGVSYQQWPKPYHYELPNGSVLDLNYRNFLIAPEGWRIVGFDYANVELRIIAGLAHERNLLSAFASGTDVHKQTASIMLKVPLDEVTDKQRAVGKTLNFAIVYGSGADNIATLITAATGEICTVEQAEAYLEQYFEAFPDLKAWMDERVLEGREEHGKPVATAASHYVTTAFGRRIPIFEYESEYRGVRNKGDRNAVNGPVQGAAADYMKIGMVRADAAIRKAEDEGRIPRGSVRLIMTIHDALEFYVRKDVDTRTVIDIIEPAVSYQVTKDWRGEDLLLPVIRADWHEGYRWGSVAEIEQAEDGEITYHRKLELPDKTKQNFLDSTLDGLVEQIDKFWADRNTTELDAKILEELDFEYDDAEDEVYIPDHVNELPDVTDRVHSENVAVRVHSEVSPSDYTAAADEVVSENRDTTLVSENPDNDEPEWAHSPTYQPTKLSLTLKAMPNTENWPKFQNWIKSRPGSATLTVHVPAGDLTFESVDVRPADEADLQLLFGSATLAVEDDSVDTDSLVEGLAL